MGDAPPPLRTCPARGDERNNRWCQIHVHADTHGALRIPRCSTAPRRRRRTRPCTLPSGQFFRSGAGGIWWYVREAVGDINFSSTSSSIAGRCVKGKRYPTPLNSCKVKPPYETSVFGVKKKQKNTVLWYGGRIAEIRMYVRIEATAEVDLSYIWRSWIRRKQH